MTTASSRAVCRPRRVAAIWTPAASIRGNNNDLRIIRGATYLDASASYKYSENFLISLQALNLTDERVISYLDSVGMRLNHGDWTGREIYLGIHYTY